MNQRRARRLLARLRGDWLRSGEARAVARLDDRTWRSNRTDDPHRGAAACRKKGPVRPLPSRSALREEMSNARREHREARAGVSGLKRVWLIGKDQVALEKRTYTQTTPFTTPCTAATFGFDFGSQSEKSGRGASGLLWTAKLDRTPNGSDLVVRRDVGPPGSKNRALSLVRTARNECIIIGRTTEAVQP